MVPKPRLVSENGDIFLKNDFFRRFWGLFLMEWLLVFVVMYVHVHCTFIRHQFTLSFFLSFSPFPPIPVLHHHQICIHVHTPLTLRFTISWVRKFLKFPWERRAHRKTPFSSSYSYLSELFRRNFYDLLDF